MITNRFTLSVAARTINTPGLNFYTFLEFESRPVWVIPQNYDGEKCEGSLLCTLQ